MRTRILDAAAVLFYTEGIRAVSADRIIAAAGTTKVTFYRHFRTKEDLVVAYLQAQSARIRAAAEQLSGDPCAGLLQLAEAMGAETCVPGFRGCPFINAAAEYPDAGSPVRAAVGRPPALAARRGLRPAGAPLGARRPGAARRPAADAARRRHGPRLRGRSCRASQRPCSAAGRALLSSLAATDFSRPSSRRQSPAKCDARTHLSWHRGTPG